ncbi:MAG: group I intron-associated PD-(D/E)XK endonuclease [Candidatus Omnitrophota bacterium]
MKENHPYLNVFYIMPIDIFSSYKSEITFVETEKRQRKPKSCAYRERWGLL